MPSTTSRTARSGPIVAVNSSGAGEGLLLVSSFFNSLPGVGSAMSRRSSNFCSYKGHTRST